MELKAKFDQMRMEQLAKYQGVNLYVKNLDDDFDDAKLRKIFEPFGTITSAKVMSDPKGVSRGFGFVCYTTPDEATKAVTDMNGKIVGSKPLYVALAQRKEFRRAQLEAQFATRKQLQARGLGVFNGPVFYPPGQLLMPPVPYPVGPQGTNQPPGPMARGRFPFPMTAPGPGYVVLPGASRGQGGVQKPFRGNPDGMMGGPRGRGMSRQPRTQNPNVTNPSTTVTTQVASPVIMTTTNNVPVTTVAPTNNVILNEPQAITPQITLQALASYSQADQKTILGDQLYPIIEKHTPELAGKITGMILESSTNEEMIELINNSAAMFAKVEEAVKVLREYEKHQ